LLEDIKYHSQQAFSSLFSLLATVIPLVAWGGYGIMLGYSGLKIIPFAIVALLTFITVSFLIKKVGSNIFWDVTTLGFAIFAFDLLSDLNWKWYGILFCVSISLLHLFILESDRKKSEFAGPAQNQ